MENLTFEEYLESSVACKVLNLTTEEAYQLSYALSDKYYEYRNDYYRLLGERDYVDPEKCYPGYLDKHNVSILCSRNCMEIVLRVIDRLGLKLEY